MPERPKSHRPPGADAARRARERQSDRDRAPLLHRRLLNRAAYRRFRLAFLASHPLCADCGRGASQVHHVRKAADHPEDMLDPANCLALCPPCHTRRTARGE